MYAASPEHPTGEAPAQKVARLLSALEDLISQESLAIRSGDFPCVLRTQQRVAPLVECLIGLAASAGDAARARIAAIVDQRRRSDDWLATALAKGRDELRQMQRSRRQLAKIRPVYGGAAGGGQQLRALG
jgi:hypothetical protein